MANIGSRFDSGAVHCHSGKKSPRWHAGEKQNPSRERIRQWMP
nr:MAG TPA: hypothetical protein [Caudoviricetes sp.]